MEGHLMIDELISARRPLEDAEAALFDLEGGVALRQLLIP
jgi:S-(hydroxymethyl)glutathione dehydrogenase/alcohol dehydrogenase